ncbi:MAG: TolB family protein, partial [bacterium]
MRIRRITRNEFLRIVLVAAMSALLFLPQVTQAITITGTVRQITTSGGSQFDPSISGDIIVYTDLRSGNADIFYYDLSLDEEFAVTNNTPTDEQLNDVSGDTIVYTRYHTLSGLGSVRAFVVGGADSPVAADPAFDQSNPGISGPIVAWEDYRAGQADIWAMDLSTNEVKQITHTTVRESDPAVNAGRIAYQQVNTDGTCQIFVTDFDTLVTDQITTQTGCHGNPDINGDTVVYDGIRSGERDIFVYNLVTRNETRLALAGVQRNPNVSGDWVAFEDMST